MEQKKLPKLIKRRAEIINSKKQCRLCLEWKDTSLFGRFLNNRPNINGERKRYINSRCKKCASDVVSKWQKERSIAIYAKRKRLKQESLQKIRDAYGNKCACCGETNPLFLTIDHVNNDGYKIRPRNKNGYHQADFSGQYYTKIIKAGFPKDLQLLCWNCNCGKHRNGGICPHKTE